VPVRPAAKGAAVIEPAKNPCVANPAIRENPVRERRAALSERWEQRDARCQAAVPEFGDSSSASGRSDDSTDERGGGGRFVDRKRPAFGQRCCELRFAELLASSRERTLPHLVANRVVPLDKAELCSQ
jgi:hypothetical protein